MKSKGVAKMMFQNKFAVSYRIESVRTTSALIFYICCYVSGGGLECVAGLAHTAQVRLGTPIFNPILSATCT